MEEQIINDKKNKITKRVIYNRIVSSKLKLWEQQYDSEVKMNLIDTKLQRKKEQIKKLQSEIKKLRGDITNEKNKKKKNLNKYINTKALLQTSNNSKSIMKKKYKAALNETFRGFTKIQSNIIKNKTKNQKNMQNSFINLEMQLKTQRQFNEELSDVCQKLKSKENNPFFSLSNSIAQAKKNSVFSWNKKYLIL